VKKWLPSVKAQTMPGVLAAHMVFGDVRKVLEGNLLAADLIVPNSIAALDLLEKPCVSLRLRK
jgi:hypothetical protein